MDDKIENQDWFTYQMKKIGGVMLNEFERIEAGNSPTSILWILRRKLLTLSNQLGPLSTTKDILKVLAYELPHIHSGNHGSLQYAKTLLTDLLMLYDAERVSFVIRNKQVSTDRKPENILSVRSESAKDI